MRVQISLKRICTVKIEEITCLNKVLAELRCLKQLKMHIAGLFNVITIQAEYIMFYSLKNSHKLKESKSIKIL